MQTVEIASWHIRPDRIARIVQAIDRGEIVALPTDTTWTLVCDAAQRGAVQKLEDVRRGRHPERESSSPMSLLCASLTMMSTWVVLDQPQFRLVRRLLPGPYTVILPASREVPRQLQSKRKTVGIRIPDHPVALAVLEACARPLLGATALRADGELCQSVTEVGAAVGSLVAVAVDSDPFISEVSTVLEYVDAEPVVLREGRGAVEPSWRVAGD